MTIYLLLDETIRASEADGGRVFTRGPCLCDSCTLFTQAQMMATVTSVNL